MNKTLFYTFLCFTILAGSCRTARQINKVIAPKDSVVVINKSITDSIAQVNKTLSEFKSHYIDFKTFSAKIKADVETSKEKLPDLTAVVRIIKDSAIWMSVSASFLNIEVYRVLITKDSVILLNKRDKEVQFRSVDYLQEVTQIPFDFKTIQDLLVGNPIFFNDSIQSIRNNDNFILISSRGEFFKHLLTLSAENKTLMHSKLDDVDLSRNRTANISYSDYESTSGFLFPTSRNIAIAEKTKIDMRLKFRQVEFNKELSTSFSIPKNYTRK
ncbi:MAG: DUF4292 domain-containing protein [Ferruginibacter sp.]